MECLFKTETDWTYAEYKRFNVAARGTLASAYLWVYSIGCIAMGVFTLFLSSYLLAIFCFIMSALLPISMKVRGIKEFNSNKVYKERKIIYEFYSDSFQLKRKGFVLDEDRIATWFYTEIFKVVETDTNFYIMLSKGSGLIIIKENCTRELIDFLQALK